MISKRIPREKRGQATQHTRQSRRKRGHGWPPISRSRPRARQPTGRGQGSAHRRKRQGRRRAPPSRATGQGAGQYRRRPPRPFPWTAPARGWRNSIAGRSRPIGSAAPTSCRHESRGEPVSPAEPDAQGPVTTPKRKRQAGGTGSVAVARWRARRRHRAFVAAILKKVLRVPLRHGSIARSSPASLRNLGRS
jgi:hypothetical protein